MTEVEFHTGVSDKLSFACRLLRKAAAKGARVIVHADAHTSADLDRALWVFDPLSFVPHARAGSKAPLETPVWIVQRLDDAPHHEVLVNLSTEVAEGFERFGRLIEVVGRDEPDVSAGRRRWRHYGSRGYAIKHHNAGADS
jgi:DNA polymerase-3 subunit chi